VQKSQLGNMKQKKVIRCTIFRPSSRKVEISVLSKPPFFPFNDETEVMVERIRSPKQTRCGSSVCECGKVEDIMGESALFISFPAKSWTSTDGTSGLLFAKIESPLPMTPFLAQVEIRRRQKEQARSSFPDDHQPKTSIIMYFQNSRKTSFPSPIHLSPNSTSFTSPSTSLSSISPCNHVTEILIGPPPTLATLKATGAPVPIPD